MKAVWELIFHENAWQVSEALTRREKIALKRALINIATDPYQKPDAERHAHDGRLYSVKNVGKFRIVYWLDPFPEELRIVEIEYTR